jgi:Sulfotransferase family
VAETGFTLAKREDRLAWILGSSRSGSTWLLRMLSAIDEVVPIDDPHLGHHLGVWRPIPLAWSTAEEMPRLTTLWTVKRGKQGYFFSDRYRDKWAPALRDLVVTRFDAQVHDVAGDTADPFVVVKEPGSHVADLIFSLFPDSRLIFLVRDGRDVVDSWIDAYTRGSWALDEGAYPLAPEGRLDMVKWLSTVWTYRIAVVQAAYERRVGSARVMLRYEDLLADPPEQLGRVCDALGITASGSDLARIAAEHAYDAVSDDDKGEGKAVRSANPGGWRTNLTAEEQRAMLEIMGEKLAELRYIPGATVPA